MPSPNKAGRPKGILDRRQKLQNAFAADAVAIAKVVIAAALEGDMQAANICLARLVPALKPQAERVAFELDAAAPVPNQIEAVLAAVADATLAPDVAQVIIASLGKLADARAVEELEARIAKLEGDQP